MSNNSDSVIKFRRVQKLLALIKENNITLDEGLIQIFLADCAIHLWADKNGETYASESCLLLKYFQGNIQLDEFEDYILDLVGSTTSAIEFCQNHHPLFCNQYSYIPNEDTLGLFDNYLIEL